MIDKPVQFIKGIGPKKAGVLKKIGISTVEELLRYYPRSYEDRRNVLKIKDIVFNNKICLQAEVLAAYEKKLSVSAVLFKTVLSDGTGKCSGIFIRHKNPYF